MQAELENRARKHRLARILDLSKYHQTISWLGEIPRRYRCLVTLRGSTFEDMLGNILRIGKQENRAIIESLHILYG